MMASIRCPLRLRLIWGSFDVGATTFATETVGDGAGAALAAIEAQATGGVAFDCDSLGTGVLVVRKELLVLDMLTSSVSAGEA